MKSISNIIHFISMKNDYIVKINIFVITILHYKCAHKDADCIIYQANSPQLLKFVIYLKSTLMVGILIFKAF